MRSLRLARAFASAIILFVCSFSSLAQETLSWSELRARVNSAPFIVISKENMTLTLVGDNNQPIATYGIACAVNYGNKKVKGDHKTPEGVFKINQLLNAKGLSHDFKDGKGPIRNAYGPWFLRLAVPGFNDIGIHGTHLPESIGTRATEGCIRLKNEDILDLKSRVNLGTPVIILPSKKDAEADAKI
ncbi:MAG: L,D-transpeptidase [Bacteroidales bacterium]|nr:L,D-transpeptidase [Bacteroidales bacterium]